jgi:hypothetical protein
MSDDIVQPAIVSERASQRGCLVIGAITAGRLAMHVFALCMLETLLCSGVPTMWRFFEETNLEVPAITALVYRCYHWMVFYWFWAIPAFLLFDAGVMASLEALSARWRWLARIWFSSVLVAALVLMAIMSMSVIVPIEQLVPLPVDADVQPAEGDAPEG